MIKNLKKVISTLAAVAILATSASAFAVSFPDVDANASYAGAVDALTALGVVNGDDNGKFNPENTVTRAEFAKMVVEALGAGNEAASSADTKFVDAKGHWAAGYIETGVAKAFINGYDEKTFGPDDKVTYAQAVKMLVAAIGYETYASQRGGWPSGYLAYGSELDIIAGVSGVGNDTALTRAQCAVLVYNTLKAPICAVNGYKQKDDGTWYPNLVEMNGKNNNNWETLLTTKHDAYVVKGRVESIARDAVKGDKVAFNVELAENYEGAKVKADAANVGAKTCNAFIGGTNADEMLFTYSEAIVQQDKDTSEYTFISITPYGAAKTVEFAVKDIDLTQMADNVIYVKKDGSSKATKYELETTGAPYYVNGEKFVVSSTEQKYNDVNNYDPSGATETAKVAGVNKALVPAKNKAGVVTLVNTTDRASTSADSDYDYVMVTYYETAEITRILADDEEVSVAVKRIAGMSGNESIDWSLVEDNTQTIKFMKDGAEIDYTELKKGDILSIAYDINGSLSASKVVEIFVSDKTVTGTVTGKSPAKATITVDGTVYEVADSIASYSLGVEYALSIDAFGFVVDGEANSSSKKFGIVASVLKDNDDATVTIITADGEVEEYPADLADANAIITAITNPGTAIADNDATTELTRAQVKALGVENAVIEYRVSSGNIKFAIGKSDVEPATSGADGMEFDKALGMITKTGVGSYMLSETSTKVLDVAAYFDKKAAVNAISIDALEDEALYNAYAFDHNTDANIYNFVVITDGIDSLRATSALAVVTSCGEETNVADETCELLTVAVDGQEDVEVYVQGDPAVKEGSIVMYKVGAEGYVETANFKVIYTPEDTETAMYNKLFASGVLNFTSTIDALTGDFIMETAASSGKYTLDIDSNATVDNAKVEIFYAPVMQASEKAVTIFTSQASDAKSQKSGVNTEVITTATANAYVYDYRKSPDMGARVSVGALDQDNKYFEGTEVDWGVNAANVVANKVYPRAAFVRVVDGLATDVVYYMYK